MKIKPIITDTLNTRHTNFVINFLLDSNVTFIAGDSGVGKTAVYSFLRELSSEDDRIICLNYIDRNKDYVDVIMRAKGKLFVIDNADILLNDNIRHHIALDTENQYIIIGRNPTGLLLSQDEIYDMESENRDELTVFRLKRMF